MEFSDLGAHCEFTGCGIQDYLPFECKYCNKNFCLEHKNHENHNCIGYRDNVIKTNYIKKKIPKNVCHICKKNEMIDLKCPKCNKNICFAHRHEFNHECIKDPEIFDKTNNTLDLKKDKCTIF